MRFLVLLVACAPARWNDLPQAPAPDGAEVVAVAAWARYGADWDAPPIHWTSGQVGSGCPSSEDWVAGGVCVFGETSFVADVRGSVEVMVGAGSRWQVAVKHELLHATFVGNWVDGDPDADHLRPEWDLYGVRH